MLLFSCGKMDGAARVYVDAVAVDANRAKCQLDMLAMKQTFA